MKDILTDSHRREPLFDELVDARRVAEGIPGAHVRMTDQTTGDSIEKMQIEGGPSITVTSEFDPEVDKLRVNAQTQKIGDSGVRSYKARVFDHGYHDGDNFATGHVEIHKTRSDGSEIAKTSNSSERAKALGGAIARQLFEQAKNK